MTVSQTEIADGRAWAEKLTGRTSTVVTDEERRTKARAEIAREVDAVLSASAAEREREEGRRQFSEATRHARAVTAVRDPDPANPVGTERRTADGTVWVRKS